MPVRAPGARRDFVEKERIRLADFCEKLNLTHMPSGVILQGRMRKRGKHGLTSINYTCKIGGFLPIYILGVSISLKLPGAAAVAGPHQQQLQLTRPLAAGNIYYNKWTPLGVVQYKNGVIHKIIPNRFVSKLMSWYNKNS
tara:strand:- start:64 stop:483 length:420 start_codon:yes stop_codon:yes gene_type:complete